MRLDPDEFVNAVGPRHDKEHQHLGRALYNRNVELSAIGAALSLTSIGFPITNVPLTTSYHDDANGPFVQSQSAASNPSDAGWLTSAFTHWRPSWGLEVRALIKTPATLTLQRNWIGLCSATPMAADDPVIHGAMFRYSPVSDTTAFWRTYTNDGAGTGTVTISDTAIAVNTVYDLRLRLVTQIGNNPFKAVFYINDRLVANHVANLPGGTANNLGAVCMTRTLAAAAQTMRVSQFKIYSHPLGM